MRKISILIVIIFLLSAFSNWSSVNESRILKNYGKGFTEINKNGLKLLHLKGTAYERGYQRGMLQDDLEYVTTSNITELMVWFGGDNPQAGLKIMLDAKKKMEPFVPYQFQQEIKGMADALAAKGSSVDYDDIMLHMISADLSMMNLKHNLNHSPKRDAFPKLSRCSSFSAWGSATKDGSLIVAGNADYYDTKKELENRYIAVVDPADGGYGYVGALWDVFFVASGINEAGIAINGHLVSSDSESLFGVSAELLLGLILQHADSIEDAVEILTAYPRTCGIIIHVADAKTKRSAIIEYTADDIAVRFAEPHEDILWTTNHFNCYPGWQGYSGLNMTPTYDERAGLEDISSIEKWQMSLEKIGRGNAGRYGRYQELLNKYHGKIDIDIAKKIISDRYSRKQGKVLDPTEPTDWDDYPIMVRQNDWEMSENVDYYKSDIKGSLIVKSGNVSSFVAAPVNGDIWWTVGVPPSAYNMDNTHINLHEELARSR
jgi:predicted choloylglycine hydrolase